MRNTKRILILTSATMALVLVAPHAHAANSFGTNGANTLVGTADLDIISAKAGSDIVSGGGGQDFLLGSSGRDRLDGQAEGDFLIDDDGKATRRERRDTLVDAVDDSTIVSADGERDSLNCGPGPNGLALADLSDSVVNCETVLNVTGEIQPNNARFIAGSSANDNLAASPAEGSTIFGKNGNDTVTGSSVADFMGGGKGRDVLDGLAGADFLIDDDGKPGDTVRGSAGADIIFAADGAAGTIDCGLNDNDGDTVIADLGLDTVINCDGSDPDSVVLG